MRWVGCRLTQRGVSLLATAALLAACGAPGSVTATPAPLLGRYTISGGGGALGPVQALTDAFLKLHPGITFVIEDVGSDAGVALTASGSVDLGMISRPLKEAERGKVALLPIGASGTGLAVNSANPITGLTKEQVKDVYSGAVTDWAAIGGRPGKITVLLRETNSSTRVAFESFLGGRPTYANGAIELGDIDQMLDSIRSFVGAIGMVTISDRTLTDKTIRLLAIDGDAPTNATMQSGAYKIGRPLSLVSHPTSVKPAIQRFLDFVRGPEGQRILASL